MKQPLIFFFLMMSASNFVSAQVDEQTPCKFRTGFDLVCVNGVEQQFDFVKFDTTTKNETEWLNDAHEHNLIIRSNFKNGPKNIGRLLNMKVERRCYICNCTPNNRPDRCTTEFTTVDNLNMKPGEVKYYRAGEFKPFIYDTNYEYRITIGGFFYSASAEEPIKYKGLTPGVYNIGMVGTNNVLAYNKRKKEISMLNSNSNFDGEWIIDFIVRPEINNGVYGNKFAIGVDILQDKKWLEPVSLLTFEPKPNNKINLSVLSRFSYEAWNMLSPDRKYFSIVYTAGNVFDTNGNFIIRKMYMMYPLLNINNVTIKWDGILNVNSYGLYDPPLDEDKKEEYFSNLFELRAVEGKMTVKKN